MSAYSVAHRGARNAASLALADMGAGPSSIKIYTEQGGVLLAVCRLANPCGTINAQGRIALQPSSEPDLVLVTGTPSWGEWCDGNGVPIWGAAVTDEWGPGPFQIKGTPEGGPFVIYAGGIVPLSDTALLG